MHMHAKTNEYADILGKLLDDTPKAVIAAIAVSLLKKEGDYSTGNIRARFYGEWVVLNQNGIVPQKPSKTHVYLNDKP